MKAAILLSGHIRTFGHCFPTLRHHVLRHFPAADFYVSTVRDADTPQLDILVAHAGEKRVHLDVHESQPVLDLPSPCPPEETWQPGRTFMHEPYAISVPPQAVLRQLWQLNECWKFFTSRGAPADYDIIIRVRPDSYFHSFAPPFAPATHLHFTEAATAWTPWWGRFGGINDRFALLSPAAAFAYFTTYAQLPRLMESGCPLHPESLIASALHAGEIDVRPALRAEFSTLKRVDGQLHSRPPEISPLDLAHASLP